MNKNQISHQMLQRLPYVEQVSYPPGAAQHPRHPVTEIYAVAQVEVYQDDSAQQTGGGDGVR